MKVVMGKKSNHREEEDAMERSRFLENLEKWRRYWSREVNFDDTLKRYVIQTYRPSGVQYVPPEPHDRFQFFSEKNAEATVAAAEEQYADLEIEKEDTTI